MRDEFKSGGSKFDPHIADIGGVDDGDGAEIPSLCFEPGHYLSWFYGQSFKVSISKAGSCCRRGSEPTLKRDVCLVNTFPNLLKPLIAFSHAFEAAAPFKTFWNIIERDPSLFNAFMRRTDKHSNICCGDFDIGAAMMVLIKTLSLNRYSLTDNNASVTASQYIVSRNGGNRGCSLLGTLVLGQTSVQVHSLTENKTFKISFPDYDSVETGAGKKEYYRTLWSRLPWVLFYRAGVILDAAGCKTLFRQNPEPVNEGYGHITESGKFYEFINSSLTRFNAPPAVITTNPYR